MEIQDIQQNLNKLASLESKQSLDFVKTCLGLHQTVLDISNKYLIGQTVKKVSKLILHHFKEQNTIKTLVLENCMLTSQSASQFLKILSTSRKNLALKNLDIGNNRMMINPKLGKAIAKILDKSNSKKLKSIILQGNMVNSGKALMNILICSSPFSQLNLYDTCLSQDCIQVISQALGEDKQIIKLDMAYNQNIFCNSDIVSNFAMSLSLNHHLQYLNLSGVTSLKSRKALLKLLTGLQMNRSLQELNLGSIGFGNQGLALISKLLLNKVPLTSLLLENNKISSRGFQQFMKKLPPILSKVDLSYNRFAKSETLHTLGNVLLSSRVLRNLNISYSLEITELDKLDLFRFCQGIRDNISLTDFVCEGAKIGDDPDYFCSMIGEAISDRKLSLTFKISAVNCFSSAISHTTSVVSIPRNILKGLSSSSVQGMDSSCSSSKLRDSFNVIKIG